MDLKKTGKLFLALSASILFSAAEDCKADIIWQGDYQTFYFGVVQNGAQFYQRNSLLNPYDPAFVPPTSGTSYESKTALSYTEVVQTSPNAYPLDSVVSMNAGAQGSSLADGLSVQAFTEMKFTGFDDVWQGISGGMQQVTASSSRRLTVDAPGLYNFSADFSGDINFEDYKTNYTDPFFGWPAASLAQHSISVTASLTGFSVNLGGEVTALTDGTNLFFDLTEDRSANANIQLRTQTDEGDDIFYQVAIALVLDAKLDNYTIYSTNTLPIETLDENGNGYMYQGTDSDPLMLRASLNPASAVPVPASALLLLSGLSGLAVFRRKTRE